jgi:drug/metabolite transporter (DMT)-like permease|tara:strand:- start:228 stop:1136 length:909 start_codon:yes stop_codon:yes gene_type:complete
MTKFLKGFLAITAAVFAWSTLEVTGSFIFAEGAGPVSVLSVRFLIATILFGGVMLFKKQTTGENLFIVEKEDRKKFLLNGIILAAHLLVYWFAWELLDPNLPVIYAIFYMYPFVLCLISIFYYGEKFSNNRKLALGFGTLGCMFAIELIPTFSLEGLNTKGVLLDVAALFTWVAYLLVGQDIMRKYKPLTIVFYDFLSVFVYVSLFQSPMTTLSEVTFNGLLAITYISVVASFIAYICYWIAVKNIGATNTGLVELGTPIFGVTLGYFFLSMSPSLWQIVGLVMISSGLFLVYKEKQVVYDQ